MDFETFRNRKGEGKIYDRNDRFTFNLNFAVTKLIDKLSKRVDVREEFSSKQSNQPKKKSTAMPGEPGTKVKINQDLIASAAKSVLEN